MKKAKGKVRDLLLQLGEIQNLIGAATNQVQNDRDRMRLDKAIPKLIRAFEICVAARSEYEPLDEDKLYDQAKT